MSRECDEPKARLGYSVATRNRRDEREREILERKGRETGGTNKIERMRVKEKCW